MNIFFMNSVGINSWGGGEKWMLTTAIGLRDRGHRIYFCGQKGSLFLDKCLQSGFETFPLKIKSDISIPNIVRLAGFFRQHEVDAVIANFNKEVRLAGIAGYFGGKPVVVARNGLAILPNKAIYKYTYQLLADGMITNTGAIKNKYLGYGWLPEDFIRVIHNGIHMAGEAPLDGAALREKLNLPDQRPVLGIFGRLVPQKQHTVFLEVAARLLAEWPTAIFLIVGDGPLKDDICKYAAELGILDSVYLVGFRERVSDLYAYCDVVLLTSVVEGLPNVVIEAMLAGCPVVAFDVGGVPELICSEKTGRVVPPNDIVLMCEKTSDLLASPAERAAIGQAARKFIQDHFSLEKMVDEVELYLRELQDRKHPEKRSEPMAVTQN